MLYKRPAVGFQLQSECYRFQPGGRPPVFPPLGKIHRKIQGPSFRSKDTLCFKEKQGRRDRGRLRTAWSFDKLPCLKYNQPVYFLHPEVLLICSSIQFLALILKSVTVFISGAASLRLPLKRFFPS